MKTSKCIKMKFDKSIQGVNELLLKWLKHTSGDIKLISIFFS